MKPEDRAEIFRLREQGVSFRKIAAVTGHSTSTIQNELNRPAEPGADPGPGVAGPVATGRGRIADAVAEDPEVLAAQRRVALARLRADELEASRRAQLLEGGKGGDGAMALVVGMLQQQASQMQQFQRDLLEARRTPAGPADPMAAMVKGLSTLAEAQNKLQAFAPPRATSIGDVELTVALEKVKLESGAKVREAESQARLYDGAFGFLKEYGPGIAQWFMTRNNQPAPTNGNGHPMLNVIQGGAAERPVDAPNGGRGQQLPSIIDTTADGLRAGESAYICSNCLGRVALAAGEVAACPKCGSILVPEAQARSQPTQRVIQ